MAISLEDFGNCFEITHNGKPCHNKKCVVTISRAEFKELMKKVGEESKRWEVQ